MGLWDLIKKKAKSDKPKATPITFMKYRENYENGHCKTIRPDSYYQDSKQSIVDSSGRYDLERLSSHEKAVVRNVLTRTQMKYPKVFQSIGLAMESYSIVYKPRYILHEIIILTYENSKQPLDQLAVGLAYATKGAFYREFALKHIELALPHISKDALSTISSVFPHWWIYNTLSDLCEGVGRFEDALRYARFAANLKAQLAPYDYIHPGSIYKKIDIQLCLSYYENLLSSASDLPFKELIQKEYSLAQEQAAKNYRYRKRTIKQSADSIEFDKKTRATAMKFINNEV